MYKLLIISFSSHQSQIKRIRRAVFCLEHNIPESKEFDDQDEAAKQKGIKKVHLSSLKHAKHFYEKHGLEQHGHPFMEVGIEHINMERAI